MEREMDENKRISMVQMLMNAGIEPNRVAIAGLDEQGYLEFQLGPRGERLMSNGYESVKVRRAWPSGFPVASFMELYSKYYL